MALLDMEAKSGFFAVPARLSMIPCDSSEQIPHNGGEHEASHEMISVDTF